MTWAPKSSSACGAGSATTAAGGGGMGSRGASDVCTGGGSIGGRCCGGGGPIDRYRWCCGGSNRCCGGSIVRCRGGGGPIDRCCGGSASIVRCRGGGGGIMPGRAGSVVIGRRGTWISTMSSIAAGPRADDDRLDRVTTRVQSKSHRPLRFGGVESGCVVPLDGDRLARCARIGARKLARVPIMRWGVVRSARVGGRGAPTEPFWTVWAVRSEGAVGTRTRD